MPSKSAKACEAPLYLYEYAVVRFVPSVEREEFINIGLLMMCKKRRWLKVRFADNDSRLDVFQTTCDRECLKQQTRSFTAIASAQPGSGPIGQLEPHERFRWLTAVRSASIQTSRPHPGKTTDLDLTFEKLFDRLVL